MVMDSEQKYIEDNTQFDIDDWFYLQLTDYKIDDVKLIMSQLVAVIEVLPYTGYHNSEEIAGVIKREDPLFFAVEYIKEEDELIMFININLIEVDEYLDFITDEKSIKSYEKNKEYNGDFQ